MPANYNVRYQRPALSLLKLRDELNAVFPGRYTGTDGFVSGYDGPNNPTFQKSGHNPNHLGHCMSFDISTPANGEQIDEATGRALSDYLRTKANIKFRYLIHDMSAGAPEGKIAGDHTKWAWWGYNGISPHSDHIHISLTDDYLWGDNCGLAQSIYDDESSWGIAEWYKSYKSGKPLSTDKPTPIPEKKDWFDMATEAQVRKIIREELKADNPWSYKNKTVDPKDAYGMLKFAQDVSVENQRRINTANANIAALTSVIEQLSKSQGVEIDYARIGAEVEEALAKGIQITGSISAGEGAQIDG